jgi:hypothetical protein
MKQQVFLQQLQQQAAKQALLNQKRFLPKQLDFVSALVGNYPWQVLIIVSGLTAVILEVLK